MSDSGGFQVFSLAEQAKAQKLKAQSSKRVADVRGDEKPLVEKISEDGVMFRSVYDGALIHFTPETSMDFQKAIGADMNMAFDECTYYPATHEYTEKAMNRTHEWLKRCITHRELEAKNTTNHQFLYGIIQGGTFEDLRKQSAEFVVAQNTPGVAIGGVSVGETKEEMRNQVKWVAPYLPKDRPVHLLGVGQVDDIVDLVKYGIDTFDCVEPTRVARMGTAYQTHAVLAHLEGNRSSYEIDLNKTVYRADLTPLDENCHCPTCVNFSKAYIHHLFKQRELLGYTLLSYHNLHVMETLMKEVYVLIGKDKL
jgi:tRNA-guanine transglycosylase